MYTAHRLFVLTVALGLASSPLVAQALPFRALFGPRGNAAKVKAFRKAQSRGKRLQLTYDNDGTRLRFHNSTVAGKPSWQPKRLTSTNVMTPKEEAFFRLYQVSSAPLVKEVTRDKPCTILGKKIQQGALTRPGKAAKRWVELHNGELAVYQAKVVINEQGKRAYALAEKKLRTGQQTPAERTAYLEAWDKGFNWQVEKLGTIPVSGLKAEGAERQAFIQLYKPHFDNVWHNGLDGLKDQLRSGELHRRLAQKRAASGR